MWYQASTNSLSINKNGQWSAGSPVGGAGTTGPVIGGDWCNVNTQQSSVSAGANSLTLNLAITFIADVSEPATMPVYMNAATNENLTTGYRQVGTFTENPTSASGFSVSISPSTVQGVAAGSSIDYTITISPYGGFNGQILFSSDFTNVNGTMDRPTVTFNPASLTGGGTTTMTVAADASNPPYHYELQVLVSSSGAGAGSYGVVGGVIVSNSPPAVSMFPTPGTGLSQAFSFVATDAGGPDNVAGMNMLFGSTLNGQNACWMFYDIRANQLWLAGDDASTWMLVGQIGSPNTASNSQCTVGGPGGGASGNANNNTYTTTVPVMFNANFAGTKTWFMNASNLAGFSSGYQSVGTWTP